MRQYFALFIALFVFSLSDNKAQTEFDLESHLVHILEDTLKGELQHFIQSFDYPGATMSLYLKSGDRLDLAAGYEDVESDKQMAPLAIMPAGSVGKTFAAATFLSLMQERDIHPYEKVAQFFEGESWYDSLPNSADLTIDMLLNHTSGLPRYIFQTSFRDDFAADPWSYRSPQQCLRYLAGMPALHKAGKGWGYSDSNYLLIGLIIEQLTNLDYYAQVIANILEKYGLTSTIPQYDENIEGVVNGYIGMDNFFQLPEKTVVNGHLTYNPGFEWTGGGFATNTRDLCTWMKILFGSNKHLDIKMQSYMLQPVSVMSGLPSVSGYGRGVNVGQFGEGNYYGHQGIFPGYQTLARWVEDGEYAIAIQVNTDQDLSRYLHSFTDKIPAILDYWKDQVNREGIWANFKHQEDCWNEGSIDCYMEAYYVTDEVQTISRGGVTKGFENIKANYLKYFPPGKMGQLHFDEVDIRKLSFYRYLVTGRFNLKFAGKEELKQGYFSVIMEKIQGKWYIVSDHSS